MTKHLAALALVLLAACGDQAVEEPQPSEPPVKADPEHRNLLNAGFGASVVWRSGELTLENSAMRAIDGDPVSAWSAPPADPKQTLVFSLPAPASINRLGILTDAAPHNRARNVSLAVSEDGVKFEHLRDAATGESAEPQFFEVSVPRARYIRVTVNEGGGHFTTLRSIFASGEWLAPRSVAPIAGCWTINGFPARFVEKDGHVTGVLEGRETLRFSGARHGAIYRFAWAAGPQWGEGLVTLSPDGNRLSGLRWHEEPAAHSDGAGWFGERRPCTPEPVDAARVAERFLTAGGWYPLFALRFDEAGSLIEEESAGGLEVIENVLRQSPSQRIRLVSREFGAESIDENRQRATARLTSLRNVLLKRGLDVARIDFDAAGSGSPRRPTPTEPYRALYSVIEIQVPAAGRSAF
ncbi:MAG TPA: discoidin domain-containing protein [Thermoanaerobaculia bacterium]|nr:discoidin domain-containing protein [Thermoanaerobaculia bacterium]